MTDLGKYFKILTLTIFLPMYISSFIWPCESKGQNYFSPRNAHIFCIWLNSHFVKIFFKRYHQYTKLRFSFHALKKKTVGLFVKKKYFFKDKLLIWLFLFQLHNLHLWQTAPCTLHTAQCIKHTAPTPANAPESAPVHFMPHIAHCTLHTIQVY